MWNTTELVLTKEMYRLNIVYFRKKKNINELRIQLRKLEEQINLPKNSQEEKNKYKTGINEREDKHTVKRIKTR